ncbi:MAG: DNA primase [Deferribacteraceae bacterium]|nr:DNA primase [Deferribacteraceae bacterium]
MPRIAQSVINEVKQLNIVDIISQHAELKKSGGKYLAICPLPNHREKTPSFTVDETKNFFFCFGCHKGGNGITFVMEYKGYDFSEAVVYLCERFGIEVKYDKTGAHHDTSSVLKNLYGDMEEYCAAALYTREGEVALGYLANRGFGEDIITRFKLGYMPKFPEIGRFKGKYGEGLLEESGIFSRGFGSMFRERLIIPIHSATGSCIALSGRALQSVEKGKYINSPETPIFMKRKVLYNFDNAIAAIKKSRSCYLVEGYFDAIRMAAAGFDNTVAMMGTAVTKERFAQLSRHAEELNLLLDGDAAGLNAMERCHEAALEAGVYPNIILLPQGEDPDSFIAKNGADALKALKKVDLIEFLIRRKFNEASDVNARFHRFDDVRLMLEKINDPYRRDRYIKLSAKIFEVNINTLTADIGSDLPQIREYSGKKSIIKNITERRFLSLLLELPAESADKVIQEIPSDYIEDEIARNLYEKIVALLDVGEEDILLHLAEDTVVGEAAALLLFGEQASADIFTEIYNCKNRILLTYYENRNRKIVNMQSMEYSALLKEFASNAEKIKELRTRLKGIVQQHG